MGGVVLSCLSDHNACHEAGYDGEGEMPPVIALGAEHEGEDAEGCHCTEDGCEVGADAHRLEELGHTCTFLGAYGEDAGYREEHADCCDEHRSGNCLHLHLRAEGIECGRTESHSGQD